jgi:AcrR family transcriptional regulator
MSSRVPEPSEALPGHEASEYGLAMLAPPGLAYPSDVPPRKQEPRRRPRRDPEAVRALLVQAAVEAYSTRPYEDVTNLEIAEAAGVSASVLYRKFPTKADLFTEALLQPFREFLHQFRDSYAERVRRNSTELEIVQDFMLELYDHLRSHRPVLAGLLVAEPTMDADASGRIRQIFEEIFTEMSGFGVEQSEVRGWFPAEHIGLLTRLLVSMVTAMVAFEPWYRPDGEAGDREFMAETMARLILYGMRMEPPAQSLKAVKTSAKTPPSALARRRTKAADSGA